MPGMLRRGACIGLRERILRLLLVDAAPVVLVSLVERSSRIAPRVEILGAESRRRGDADSEAALLPPLRLAFVVTVGQVDDLRLRLVPGPQALFFPLRLLLGQAFKSIVVPPLLADHPALLRQVTDRRWRPSLSLDGNARNGVKWHACT